MKDTIWIIVLITTIITVIAMITVIIFNNNNGNKIIKQGEKSQENIEENKVNNIKDDDKIENVIASSSSTKEKLSPNASLIFYEKYIDCGHIIRKKEKAEEEMINLSKDDFQKLYNDWEVINFSNNEVELYKESPGECGEHYMVKEKEGHIAVYKINLNNEEILMDETDIETQYLPETDKENMKKGIKIYTEETLNAYLENFE